MATIPQFVSKETPTNQPGAEYRSEGATGGLADNSFITNAVGEKASEQVFELGNAMRRIDNSNALSKSTIQTTEGMHAIEMEVEKNPDLANALKDVPERVRKLGEITAQNFNDPVARQQYLNEYGLTSVKFMNQLQTNVYNRQVKESDFYGKRDMNIKAVELASITDPDLREQKKQEMLKIGAERERLGVWERYQTEENYQASLVNSAEVAIATNYAAVEAELDKKDGGIYSDIPADKRVELQGKVTTQKRIEKAARRELEENTMYDLTNRVLNNTVNEEEIDMLVAQNQADPYKGISKETGLKLKDALYRQIVSDINKTEAAKKYVKAANKIFLKTPDRVKAYDAILEALDKENPEEMAFLTQLTTSTKKGILENAARGWRAIGAFFAGKNIDDAEEQKEITKNFITRIRNGQDGYLAAQGSTWDKEVKDHPVLATTPDVAAIYKPGRGTTVLTSKKPKE